MAVYPYIGMEDAGLHLYRHGGWWFTFTCSFQTPRESALNHFNCSLDVIVSKQIQCNGNPEYLVSIPHPSLVQICPQ